jgi:hypothetical protein
MSSTVPATISSSHSAVDAPSITMDKKKARKKFRAFLILDEKTNAQSN